MKKIFLDTEFTSLTQNAQLISIAMVADSGETFYALSTDFNPSKVSDFIRKEVLPFIRIGNPTDDPQNMRVIDTNRNIAHAIRSWLKQFGEEKNSIQIWADVSHYDWVLFCDIFGGALNIPQQIHYMCMDLATLLYAKGYDFNIRRTDLLSKTEIPDDYNIHNALSDAQIGMVILKKLIE